MKTNPIGKFFISRDSLTNWRNVLPAFSQMVVVEARARWDMDVVEYIALSDLFEEVPEHTAAPLYEFEFTRTLSGEILTKCKKSDKPYPYL